MNLAVDVIKRIASLALAPLIAMCLFLAGPANPALGVNYTVDTTADDPGVTLTACTAAAGDCSLRGAITNANAPGTDFVLFDADVFPPDNPATITIASSLPVLTGGSNAISGSNRGVIIDGAGEPSAFNCLTIDSSNNNIEAIQFTDCTTAILVSVGTTGNVIVENVVFDNSVGIAIAGGSTGNTILANRVGTNEAGTAVHPGGGNLQGIQINGDNNEIGSTDGPPNVVSGNNSNAIVLNPGADGNIIRNNRIGTNANGTVAIPNAGNGITIVDGNNNIIGGPGPFDGNTIANSTAGRGISIGGGTGNSVDGNAIHSNALLGLDLGANGVSANDVGDADGGPNNLQNFPVLTSAFTTGSSLTVDGTLNSTGSQSFTIQFFANGSCDSSGNGEGQTYLGLLSVMTDGSGNTGFSTSLSASVPAGQLITANATRTATGDTSEFSACLTAIQDTDGDTVPDSTDNCPNWPNPGQTLPAWALPADDPDCDGFTTARETYLTTNATKHCAATGVVTNPPAGGVNDEPPPDFWPLDMNDSQQINTVDVGFFVGKLGLDNTEVGWTARLDLSQSPNGIINTVDVGFYVGRLGLACAPVGP